MQNKILFIFIIISSGLLGDTMATDDNTLLLTTRFRQPLANSNTLFETVEQKIEWQATQTAIIICDMWNEHWCKGATRRVIELAEKINQFVSIARDKGVLIVHAPSSVVDYYTEHPARQKVFAAPQAQNVPKNMGKWCDRLEGEPIELWPIDQSDGGCDCTPTCEQGTPWKKQIDIIDIFDNDIISDDGVEIWNVLELYGIKNVILVGVHANMCVIGRPFGLRNMKRVNVNVLLCRDLTDTMYNSRSKPYVSHFEGTELIVKYIEKYICPTIVSSDLTSEPPFRFKGD